MNVRVNGRELELERRCTVEALLERCDLAEAACAVEVNAVLVPRPDHAARELAEGDRIEIVTLVGGG